MNHSITKGALLALVPLVLPVEAVAQQDPDFSSGQFRLDLAASAPPGHAVLELTSATVRGTRIRLEVDTNVRVEFRDDGLGLDQRRDDGVYTGAVPTDIQRERQTFDRLVASLERGVEIPIFKNRKLVEKIDSRKLIPKPMPGVLPLLGSSGNNSIIPEKSLFITDPAVLTSGEHSINPCTGTGSPDGAWSFGHVVTELAGENDPIDFLQHWLFQYDQMQWVNGVVEERNGVLERISDAWDIMSDGAYDLATVPFHPVAIILRADLRQAPSGYGGAATNGGEARIVYSFVDENCSVDDPFLIIFEYAIEKTGCELKQWGEDWAALSSPDLSPAEYADSLAALTRQFTDLTSSPNANRLSQVRTNERIIFPWELREFRTNNFGLLDMDPLKETPHRGLNDSPEVGNMMVDPANRDIPAFESMFAGAISVPFPPSDEFWISDGALSNDWRHELSLNTCNACHGGETGTFFTHVKETVPGTETVLSAFLTGDPGSVHPTDPDFNDYFLMIDPVGGETRPFFDLERRRVDLQNLVDSSCFNVLLHDKTVIVH